MFRGENLQLCWKHQTLNSGSRAMHAILPARGSTLCVRSGGYCCRFAARAANKTLTNQSQPSVSLSSEKKTERRARTFVLAFFQRIAFLMRNSAEKYNRNGLSIEDNPTQLLKIQEAHFSRLSLVE